MTSKMSAPQIETTIQLERAVEQLRQERETFEQQKRHDAQWFMLRLLMGYSSVVLLFGILGTSSYIIFNAVQFSATVVAAAGGALFVDAVGLVVSVWKGALNQRPGDRLSPVTRVSAQ